MSLTASKVYFAVALCVAKLGNAVRRPMTLKDPYDRTSEQIPNKVDC